jgi:spore coat polysaccharide biosynthesis protein SpsF
MVNVNLLIPKGDEILTAIEKREIFLTDRDIVIQVIEGPEHDVLTRYVEMAKKNGSDYIVRITADCPLIPPYLIHKTITNTIMGWHDYCSNIEIIKDQDNKIRLSIDGHDCEVMTRKLLDWLDQNAKGVDREHVTTLFRRSKPIWANRGFEADFANFSSIKLSVDTPEDLENVRSHFDAVSQFVSWAEGISGKRAVHRI